MAPLGLFIWVGQGYRNFENSMEQSRQLYVFESGEEEVQDEFNLLTCRPAAKSYLKSNLNKSKIEVGTFDVGKYPHYSQNEKKDAFLLLKLMKTVNDIYYSRLEST